MKNKGKITSLILSATLALTPIASIAHSGRTDDQGGHRDNKNRSGLGYYHFHHGYGPHLHKNGICPYSSKTVKKSISTVAKKSKTSSTATKEANKKLQNKLNELDYNCGTADGILGAKSKAAIKAFQKDKGLIVDGIAGTKTKAALGL